LIQRRIPVHDRPYGTAEEEAAAAAHRNELSQKDEDQIYKEGVAAAAVAAHRAQRRGNEDPIYRQGVEAAREAAHRAQVMKDAETVYKEGLEAAPKAAHGEFPAYAQKKSSMKSRDEEKHLVSYLKPYNPTEWAWTHDQADYTDYNSWDKETQNPSGY
jgi:hypothetical protein